MLLQVQLLRLLCSLQYMLRKIVFRNCNFFFFLAPDMYYLTDFSVRNLGVAYLESSSSGSFIYSQAVGWGCSQSQGLAQEGESSQFTGSLAGLL